jgi:CRP/FNR family transcriptional regulator, cyclic AMP receptor protein
MSNHHPDAIFWGLNFRRKKSADVSRNEFLRTIPFFEHLTLKQIKILGQHLHDRRYEENEFIFESNHPGAALFIIFRGEISVDVRTSDGEITSHLATIKSGEFLGELALLDQSPRSACARAVKPTQAYALFRTDLIRLSETNPEIACEIYRTLASIIGERLKATNRHVGSTRKAA